MTPPNTAAARGDRERRKRNGVFYTPDPVARYIAQTTLSSIRPSPTGQPPRILDPACGDGALLWQAFLCRTQQNDLSAASQVDCVRQQLFGVDLDPGAIDQLRDRFRRMGIFGRPSTEPCREGDAPAEPLSLCAATANEAQQKPQSPTATMLTSRLGATGSISADSDLALRSTGTAGGTLKIGAFEKILTNNFRCGNAINGDCWQPGDTPTDAFHWHDQFPEVCQAGGFDAIIANPPYRRERGAKSDRATLQNSPLAQSRNHARMDLWHYFFHRSLDLLRPGGIMTFIINSYWTTSEAGRPLIERMAAETTPLEFVLLDTAPVFPGVGGRHLIVKLRKGITNETCQIVSLPTNLHSEVLNPSLWAALETATQNGTRSNAAIGESSTRQRRTGLQARPSSHVLLNQHDFANVRIINLPRDNLFRNSRLNFEHPVSPAAAGCLSVKSTRHLGDLFEVRQGIAENPPRITRQQALDDPTLQAGEGVFVLTPSELASLELSSVEQALLRPYYSAADIERYWQPPAPQQWLLYLTRQSAPTLGNLPRIEHHLTRFRTILERRREVQQGKIAWWHLHWPREPRLFASPRILAVQMADRPRFAHVKTPTYVGFSVNLIVDRQQLTAEGSAVTITLDVLETLLNSQLAADWFQTHAKRRGINLDITGNTLKQFPLPEIDSITAQQLIQLGQLRRTTLSDPAAIESEIDTLVDQLYSSTK